MRKVKKYFFVAVLAITVFIASPFIYKKIWDNSSIKFMLDSKDTENSVQNGDTDKEPPIEGETVTTAPVTEPEGGSVSMPGEETSPEAPSYTVPEENVTDTPATAEPASQDGGTDAPAVPDTQPAVQTENETESVSGRSIRFGDAPEGYFDDALFIGDSRMVGISEYGTFDTSDFFCDVGLASYKIGKEVVDGRSLADVLASKQYGKIYVMVGVNECGNDPDYFIGTYKKMIDSIRESQSEDTVIYLMANLHVTSAKSSDGYVTNENITAQNVRIENLASEYGNRTYYINCNETFEDANGCLIADTTSDGVHFYARYYTEWCDYVRASAVQSDSLYS